MKHNLHLRSQKCLIRGCVGNYEWEMEQWVCPSCGSIVRMRERKARVLTPAEIDRRIEIAESTTMSITAKAKKMGISRVMYYKFIAQHGGKK